MPVEEFEREIANRSVIEACLILRVHGRGALGPGNRLWVRDADGLWTTTNKLAQKPTCPPGVFEFFFPDDVGDDARVMDADDPAADRDVIDCTIARVPDSPGPQMGHPAADNQGRGFLL